MASVNPEEYHATNRPICSPSVRPTSRHGRFCGRHHGGRPSAIPTGVALGRGFCLGFSKQPRSLSLGRPIPLAKSHGMVALPRRIHPFTAATFPLVHNSFCRRTKPDPARQPPVMCLKTVADMRWLNRTSESRHWRIDLEQRRCSIDGGQLFSAAELKTNPIIDQDRGSYSVCHFPSGNLPKTSRHSAAMNLPPLI